MQWSSVDRHLGYLRLDDSETGRKAIPLGPAAIELLKRQNRIRGKPFVFAGKKEGAHLVGLPKIWERVRQRAGLDGVRLHHLRHCFASVGVSAGDSLPMIASSLAREALEIFQLARRSNKQFAR